MFAPGLLPSHMGQLHAYEQALFLVLAFGPFVVLAVVVWIVRRRDIDEGEGHGPSPGQ
jgi:hypothetical protein